jgi:glycosyltransferase involved in cell wall biosynthesis
VIATGELLAARMAGPAIRAWHMAAALAVEHDVELVSFRGCELNDPTFRCSTATRATRRRLAAWADVVVVQGDVLRRWRALGARSMVVLIVDLYDPFHLEALERARGLGEEERRVAIADAVDVVNDQLRRGDRFLCAGERQRDFWIGHLVALGRVNDRTYDDDRDLRRLVAVVPFGVEDEPPRATTRAFRGVRVGEHDEIIVWGGGIYDWFDPLTLVEAVDRLRRRRPTLRLLFAGARHPNPDVGETAMAARTRALADELGLTGVHVFFDDWTPYADRQNVLLEADLGVTTHGDDLETMFAFRTRVLDYLWASLPVVTTAGDALADAVVACGAGLAVPPRDVDALEAALDSVLADDVARAGYRERSGALAREYRWSVVLRPLVAICRAPEPAPDLTEPALVHVIRRGPHLAPSPARRAMARVWQRARAGEWRELLSSALARARPPR